MGCLHAVGLNLHFKLDGGAVCDYIGGGSYGGREESGGDKGVIVLHGDLSSTFQCDVVCMCTCRGRSCRCRGCPMRRRAVAGKLGKRGSSVTADVSHKDRKSTRLNSSHVVTSRMPSSA